MKTVWWNTIVFEAIIKWWPPVSYKRFYFAFISQISLREHAFKSRSCGSRCKTILHLKRGTIFSSSIIIVIEFLNMYETIDENPYLLPSALPGICSCSHLLWRQSRLFAQLIFHFKVIYAVTFPFMAIVLWTSFLRSDIFLIVQSLPLIKFNEKLVFPTSSLLLHELLFY
jgi:hypothetical protein